ncbi:MAG: hypothetical protein SFX18_10500 [Pirellulales bacterium]|nr:hypothetical protein [Pirellulales bacterium]
MPVPTTTAAEDAPSPQVSDIPLGSESDAQTATPSALLRQPATSRPAATWRGKLLALGLGLVVALLLAEICLRIGGFSAPIFYAPHSVYGTALRPNVAGWYRLEGVAWNAINSAGFRDLERTVAKPPGTLRIAVLGDSFTAAHQVPLDQTYCQLLENKLSAALPTGQQVQVLNFGVNGYGLAQQTLVWREVVRQYQPDVVLLAMFLGNDISDNSPEIDPRERPYFTLAGDVLTLDNRFLKSPYYLSHTRGWKSWLPSLLDTTRLGQLCYLPRSLALVNYYLKREEQSTTQSATEAGLYDGVYRDPGHDPRWQQAWRITELGLRELNREVQSTGAKFMVVTLSTSLQASPDQARQTTALARLGVADLYAPDRHIGSYCDELGISRLTLAPQLHNIAKKLGQPLHGTAANPDLGHWNQAGHAAVAELISPWLLQNLDKSPASLPGTVGDSK